MEKYNWKFANVGGSSRVCVTTADDIRHLHELDQKMWTVLSCPTSGLEIADESLQLMDVDGDGKLRVKEVMATSQWLCAVLRDPETLFAQRAEVALDNIQDEAILALAKQLVGDKTVVELADLDNIPLPTFEDAVAPEAPLEANVIAAYKACQASYAAYFETAKMAKLGLATLAEDAVEPAISEKKFLELGKQIADYEAACAAVQATNAEHAAAIEAAKAAFLPLRKLLILSRDFCRLLRNFVTLVDFYDRKDDTIATFQAGTLVIDQRACSLCMRVADMAKHDQQAGLSGMYLIYCDCTSQKLGKTMKIVAAMTVGDVRNLSVGKNAIFYDNQGNDYDAVVVKIIDNPISVAQAFWTPYKKFADWVGGLINKSVAEKESKGFEDMKANATAATEQAKADAAAGAKPQPQPFDIAKFAGIFAAVGMALGAIGTALVALASGLAALAWWQVLLVIVGVLLCISGPSMLMAYFKLRRRNLAPLLNANGWAVNADAKVSVPFGVTLTSQAQFPLLKGKAKSARRFWCWFIACLLVVGLGVGAYFYFCPCCEEECEAGVQPTENVEETPADEVVVGSEGE